MKLFDKILYNVIFGIWYVVSSLPFCVHYFFSDIMQFLLYYIIRYRRKVVHDNIRSSFPDKTPEEIKKIERDFYAHFCDIIVEQVKYFSISEKEMKKHMVFKGMEQVDESCKNGHSCALFLGHYCNWEWVATAPLWLDGKYSQTAQLYHPFENKIVDRLMDYIRSRFGGINIPVEQSLRHIVKYQKQGKSLVIGFIADQVPLYTNIHYWTNFLNHPETPLFTGGERIMRMLDMDVYYLHIRRLKRGYYETEYKLMVKGAKQCKEFELTEMYTRMLEQNIIEAPALWLWTHRRWKRTYAGWLEDQEEIRQRHEEKMKKINEK